MALKLVWRIERQVRGELTDEVEVEFIDATSLVPYQRGSVLVPKRPTPDEIAMFVNRRRATLEVEAEQVVPPAEPPRPEVVLSPEIAGTVFGEDGRVALPGDIAIDRG